MEQIDTIDLETGNISKDSALNLVVFGDTTEHLELLDGVLIDLLKTKWNTFVKSRFYQQFYLFALYFIVSMFSFLLRPGPAPKEDVDDDVTTEIIDKHNKNGNNTMSKLISGRTNQSLKFLWMNKKETHLPLMESNPYWFNQTDDEDSTDFISAWWSTYSECPLLNTDTVQNKMRLISEVILLIGAFLYILAALRESRFLGYKMFIENLMTAPSRVMFLFSCCIMMMVPWLRFACSREMEDHVAVVIMLTTAPYFLFFCRGFKTVGPFVVMIYRMVMGDLIRFVSIYLVFVMGFSQAYYIIFLSFDVNSEDTTNPVPSPMESVVAMFLMSLTNFGDYYGAMDQTNHEPEAKILFVLFMVIVAVLLVNMLIAMMGNTYQKIAETRNEWQRQWARIVLVVERSVAPAERLKKFNFYSQPMSDGRPALVLRLNMTDDDKEEMKEILEMKRVHDRLKKKRAVEREKREQEQAKEREKLMNKLQNNGI